MRRVWIAALVTVVSAFGSAHADDWPQWLGPQRDGIWRESGIVKQFPKDGLKVRWKAPVGEGYAGPAMAGDKVIVTDRILKADAKNPGNPFDAKTKVEGLERVLCLSDADGKVIWKHEYPAAYQVSYPAGPRTTPIVSDGKVYTLGAMGHLFCFNLEDGKILWSKNLLEEYTKNVPYWGFAGHPLIDGDNLICLVGGKGSVAVAFNKDTGKEVWKALTANEPGYSPPTICTLGGKRQLIIWHPEAINGLDPKTGETYWSMKYPASRTGKVKAGLTVSTPRCFDAKLFLTTFYEGAAVLKFDGDAKPSVVWKGNGKGEKPEDTDTLNSIMPTPYVKDGYVYGISSYGELRCLEADTGKRIWSTLEATTGKETRWGNAFLTQHEDRFFLFNERGELVLAKLTPKGYEEISRQKILEPTNTMAGPGRKVIWSHPAYAHRNIYARNDKEIVSISLAE